jgi:hypothetical protein
MPQLRLPLWLVTERKREVPPALPPCDDASAVLAFTNTQSLAEMLRAGRAGRWKIELVSEAKELVVAVADLHQKGVQHVCLDPATDGSGGKKIALAEMLQFCQDERQR